MARRVVIVKTWSARETLRSVDVVPTYGAGIDRQEEHPTPDPRSSFSRPRARGPARGVIWSCFATRVFGRKNPTSQDLEVDTKQRGE